MYLYNRKQLYQQKGGREISEGISVTLADKTNSSFLMQIHEECKKKISI